MNVGDKMPPESEEVIIFRRNDSLPSRGYHSDGIWWESLGGEDAQVDDVIAWELITDSTPPRSI